MSEGKQHRRVLVSRLCRAIQDDPDIILSTVCMKINEAEGKTL